MRYRVLKCATSLAYFCLIFLTWRWFALSFEEGFAGGAAVLSAYWGVLTLFKMPRFLNSYCDVFSRLLVLVPLVGGVCLSVLALVAFHDWSLKNAAAIELYMWVCIYLLYRSNKRNYINIGHGPLPAGCWVNPDLAAIEPGDLILISNRIARAIGESVAHGELAIRLPDGRMGTLSCHMAQGVVLNDLEWLISRWLGKGNHYIVLKLRSPLTDEQVALATRLADEMRAQNCAWRERVNARSARLSNLLPMPRPWREWLVARTRATGYDWLGILVGGIAKDRWTCIGACLALLRRLGVRTRSYGTGLFGLGDGLLDPIKAIQCLDDQAFRLLSLEDKAAADVKKVRKEYQT